MNIKRIMLNFGLEEKKVFELIDIFMECSKSDLDMLEEAAGENSALKAARHAHSLKGAALNFGLDEISQKAQEIELIAMSGILEGVFESVILLRRMLEDVAQELR